MLTSAKLWEMYVSDLYQFYNFDVNADGIKDKIITHQNDEKNFHQGSDLFVYLGNKNNRYKLNLKAEILDPNFDPQVPSNYYIKGDVIEVFSQNEDWIEVSYKNETKRGWVDKRNVKAL